MRGVGGVGAVGVFPCPGVASRLLHNRDPLKDPKNGTPQNEPQYYIGEPRVVLRGSIFWILLGVWEAGLWGF